MALYSNSLQVIRHYLSAAMGDLISGTAGSGTSTTLVSTLLRKADDYYNNHHYRCYIYAGTNIGEEREVSDWTLTSPANTLTLAPAYTAAIDNTSKYELHHIFNEDEYRKAINMGIESMAGKYLANLVDDTTITLVADTYEYALPTNFLYLHRVTTEKEVAGDEFDASDEVDVRDWSIIKAYPPMLKLHEDRYSITAGKDLRLEGYGTQAIVSADTDTIYLPPKWLVAEAILSLPHSKVESNNLDGVLAQASRDVITYRLTERNYPHPRARKIVE